MDTFGLLLRKVGDEDLARILAPSIEAVLADGGMDKTSPKPADKIKIVDWLLDGVDTTSDSADIAALDLSLLSDTHLRALLARLAAPEALAATVDAAKKHRDPDKKQRTRKKKDVPPDG